MIDEMKNEVGKNLRATLHAILSAQPHDAERLQDCMEQLARELIVVASMIGVPPYDMSLNAQSGDGDG